MEIPKFRIRCSQIGKIMGGAFNKPTELQLVRLNALQLRADGQGNPLTDNMKAELKDLIEKRDAGPQLQAGAKTYLQDWMKEQLYNRTKDFSNQYTEKGILCEPAAIEFVAKVMGYGLVEKNTVRMQNDWCEGECDLLLADSVEDIKNSWDVFTFPLFAEKLPESDYFYQLQGYMWLYGKDKAAVNYCLIDAPEEILDQVAFSVSRKAGLIEVDAELHDLVRMKMTYPDIPDALKLKRFEFERHNGVIDAIMAQVKLCQAYINQEWPKIFENANRIEKSEPVNA